MSKTGYTPSKAHLREEDIEFRHKMATEMLSGKMPGCASDAPEQSQAKSLAFKLSIEKLNGDDPETGIERIAIWMSRVGDYYSCAVSFVERDGGSSYYKAIVCFKTKKSAAEVRSVFPMARVSALFDYKKSFYNTIFGIEGQGESMTRERTVLNKVIGEISCSIESKQTVLGGPR